jgi:hypothetical protein
MEASLAQRLDHQRVMLGAIACERLPLTVEQFEARSRDGKSVDSDLRGFQGTSARANAQRPSSEKENAP